MENDPQQNIAKSLFHRQNYKKSVVYGNNWTDGWRRPKSKAQKYNKRLQGLQKF